MVAKRLVVCPALSFMSPVTTPDVGALNVDTSTVMDRDEVFVTVAAPKPILEKSLTRKALLGFAPEVMDSKYHRLKVSLTAAHHTTVQARRGYVATAGRPGEPKPPAERRMDKEGFTARDR